ncbi:cupin domain-containing protein [Geoalkalibacter halelectricus]|uniref:Cupin domain-containing protein n=1 Tax=Geoalkalibacter halelectricus TaxID=2847045 RepID=A0ABY5ZGJ8_9BACT|nr:cupin domain-containing protein [Geoalkalibacter halelectricus]MDO3380203.1 cupin domain-containing protein [Geoalkalibacter halelectricus]UWZ78226.1 cupin domain-containing protein [Geoalkalibacter halelectricus]
MTKQNLFQDIPSDLPEEFLQTLAGSEKVRIERIVSRGHKSPEGFWYDQDQNEFVLLLQGEAELELLEPVERLRLIPGDWLIIPARRKHRVAATSTWQNSIWLAVFFE